jgi:DNA-binding XRE family transcriptional regulator
VLISAQHRTIGYCVDMDTSREGQWRASNPTELGKALARLRMQAGLTQEDMATHTRVPRTYLARMEAGLGTEQLVRTFTILRYAGYELALVPRSGTHG